MVTRTKAELVFVFWENRPAIIDGARAFAILVPGEGWTEVDNAEVADSGRVMREEHWREFFLDRWGHLDMPDLVS